MPLPTKTFTGFVADMANALANGTTKVTNLRAGSVAYAFIRAVAANAIALQQMLVAWSNVTRLSTSFGNDVDTFVGDYGLTRLTAVATTMPLLLNRSITGVELDIPLGGIVQTAINGVQFTLIGDTNQPAYDPVRNLYVFGSTQNQIQVLIQALIPGSAGNVAPGTVTQMVAGLVGVNSVTNPLQGVNGADKESDSALKSRFVRYLRSLRTSNKDSIDAAVESVQPNLSYKTIQYQHFDGTAFPAGFTVVVDDGTGNASTPFLNAVYAAVDAVRAGGIEFEVHAPNNVTANVDVTVNVATGGNLPLTQANVTNAIKAYIQGLGVGVLVSYVDLGNVIQNTPGVFSYSGLLINGQTADLAISNTQLAIFGAVTYH